MAQIEDPIATMLQSPGAPFELTEIEVNGVSQRVLKQSPRTLGELIDLTKNFSDRELIVLDDLRITYSEALSKAAALAATINKQIKVQKGTRIALVMHNRPEWMISFIAIAALGATAVLVNSRGTAAEINAALAVTDSALVIADAARAQLLDAQTRPLIVVEDNVVTDKSNDTALKSTWIAYETATANWLNATLSVTPTEPDDEAIVMFTSGTTGGAKGALLSQRGVIAGVMNIQYSKSAIGLLISQLFGFEAVAALAQRQPAALLVFPLFHSSGCYAVFLSSLMSGGKIVVLPKWNAEHALDLIEREKIAGFSGSPTMWWDILQVERSNRDLSSLISIGIGGQALHKKLMHDVVAAFPRAMLGVGFGMTETNGSVCQLVGPALLERPTTSGRVMPTADLKIVDEDGNEVAPDTVGEIWVRGAMVMKGYCKQPQATAEVLHDGWMKTGDLGRLDRDGYLHIVDRKKNIVISGGENISCTEVEGAALEIDAIAHAAAIGVPDDRLGERLILAVVLCEGAAIDDEEIKRQIGERIAIYKVPRQIVRVESLPYNAMGKVNRNEVREKILAQI